MNEHKDFFDNYSFVKLDHANGSWNSFESDWRQQCDDLEEDFESYAGETFNVLNPLAGNENKLAGVFALVKNQKHLAVCQVNTTLLPKHDGPVMRVRFITMSPQYDLRDIPGHDYGEVLVSLLYQVIQLAYIDEILQSKHIKFHVRSPSDLSFFTAFSHGLKQEEIFHSVQMSGSWLYITRK